MEEVQYHTRSLRTNRETVCRSDQALVPGTKPSACSRPLPDWRYRVVRVAQGFGAPEKRHRFLKEGRYGAP